MFKPRVGSATATKTGGATIRRAGGGGVAAGGGGGALGGAAGAKLQYPASSGSPAYFQAKHLLPNNAPIHSAAILRCEYSPDGSRLVTASVDKTARVLRLPLAKHGGDGTDLIGHTGAVGAVSWSHDGSLVLTCSSADRSARLWHSGKADPMLTFKHVERSAKVGATLTPFIHEVRAARFLHLDRFALLAAGSRLHLYRYWLPDETEKNDIKRLAAEGKYKLAATFQSGVQAVNDVVCANGFVSHVAITAGSNRSIEVLDMGCGRWVRRWEDAHSRPVHTLALASGSKYCSHTAEAYELFASSAADSDGGCVKLWDLRASRCVRRFSGHANRQHAVGVAFSPCMRFLATGSEDKSAYLYDTRMGTILHRLRDGSPGDVVSDVSFHPLHPQLATCSFDGRVRFFSDKNAF